MIIRFAAPGAESKDYVFRPKEELSPTCEAIELLGGEVWDNYEEFMTKFNSSNRRAQRAALWAAIHRDDPESTLVFADFSYPAAAVVVVYEDAELDRIRESIRNNPDLDQAEKDRLLSPDMFGPGEPAPEVAVPKDSGSDSPPEPTDTESDEPSTGGQ
jgi:hypothetical protein